MQQHKVLVKDSHRFATKAVLSIALHVPIASHQDKHSFSCPFLSEHISRHDHKSLSKAWIYTCSLLLGLWSYLRTSHFHFHYIYTTP